MISWRWKLATVIVATVVMGLVIAWPEDADADVCVGLSCRLGVYPSTPAAGEWVHNSNTTAVTFWTFFDVLVTGSSPGMYVYKCASGPNYTVLNLARWNGSAWVASQAQELIGSSGAGWVYGAWNGGSVAMAAGELWAVGYTVDTGSAGAPNGHCQHNMKPVGGLTSGTYIRAATSPGSTSAHTTGTSQLPYTGLYTSGNYAPVDIAFDVAATPTPTPTPVPLHQVISDSTTIIEGGVTPSGYSRGNVVRVMNSGSITHVRIGRSTNQSSSIDWAIYPYGSGAPVALGTATGLSVGWNTIDIPDVAISAGFYVPTFFQVPGDNFGYITAMTCPSGAGNNTSSTQIYYAGPCARLYPGHALTYPHDIPVSNLMYAVDMRVDAPATTSATATPYATSTPFGAVGTATPAATVTQFNTPDLVGAVNRLGDILQRVGDQITAAILVHGVMQAFTTMLDRLQDLIAQIAALPLLMAGTLNGALALPGPEYLAIKNAELDLLLDAKTGGLGGIIDHLDFVEDLLEPECAGWEGIAFTLPNPRPGQAPMEFAFPPGNLWDNIYCPYIRPWLSLSLNFVFLFVAWRNGLKIFRLKD